MKTIYDGIFEWPGWGGRLRLGSGKCRLRIYNLLGDARDSAIPLKSTLVIVSDVPGSHLRVRSCASHVATCVVETFEISPQRMLFVEYRPASTYGKLKKHTIAARYEGAVLTWQKGKALEAKWRSLPPAVEKIVKTAVAGTMTN